MKTVLQLLSSMAIHINGDTTVPTTGDDEYLLWVESLNQAQDDWANIDYKWPQLMKTLNTTLLVSGTSIGLPSDFKKLEGYPTFNGTQFPEVSINDVARFETSDAFVSVDYNGNYLAVHPARTSTETVSVRYNSRPTSLATTTSTSLCPNDNYLIYSATAKVLFSRDDGKYVDFESKADGLSQQMIGTDVHEGIQMDTRVKSAQELRGFTLGVN
jgi:hypothetical protein